MLQISKWVEAHKASRGLGWGLAHHHFCCLLLAKVTRPSQIQGVRNKFHLFTGGALKSSCIGYGFREGWRVVFISSVNVLFLPLIKLAKFPHRDRHDFCRMHEAGGMGSPCDSWIPKRHVKPIVADDSGWSSKYFFNNQSGKTFSPSWLGLVYKCQAAGMFWVFTYVSDPGGTAVSHTDGVPDFGLTGRTERQWLHVLSKAKGPAFSPVPTLGISLANHRSTLLKNKKFSNTCWRC